MTEAQVSEAILALASAVSGKDLTSEGDGTKATALTVLSDALGGQETDADTALYDAAQFATRRSTDTEEAAKSVLALSSGGGAQSYPITFEEVTGGTVEFQDASTYQTVTSAPAGTVLYVRINGGSGASGGSIECKDVDFRNVLMIYGDDFHNDAYVAMPIGGMSVYADLQ